MSICPWNKLGSVGSPFVLVFSKLGISAAAGIINFVVLTAALSACNSGIFSTGRMLYNLSLQGTAPKMFGKLSKSHVPMNGILISACFTLIGVVLNYLVPGKVFTYVSSVATFGGVWVWGVIVISQMKFRKGLTREQVKKLKFPSLFYPYANWISLAFLVLVVIVMFFNPDTRVALIVAPVWFGTLTAIYYIHYVPSFNKNKTYDVEKDVV